MTTSDLIAEARAKLAAATPGPWEDDGYGVIYAEGPDNEAVHVATTDEGAEGDAPLIAAAPTLIAQLCDRLEAAERVIEAAHLCRGFQWIGQTFASCEGCGRPAHEHEGFDANKPGSGFPGEREVIPWHVAARRIPMFNLCACTCGNEKHHATACLLADPSDKKGN